MSRKKIKIYKYDLKGVFKANYESMFEYQMDMFGYKKPIFRNEVLGIPYELDKASNTIAFKQRVYRDDVVHYLRLIGSKLLKCKEDKPVVAVNLIGEVVAWFKNKNILQILCGEDSATISRHLANAGRTHRHHLNRDVEYMYEEDYNKLKK